MFPSMVFSLGRKACRARVIRDMKQRQVVERTEVIRRAYLFVARNTTLPDSVRARAQMKLHALPRASCPSRINLTCTETGVARAVLREFKLYRGKFRTMALAGEIPGVKKAEW